jgi:hypothetical protein
MVSDVVLAHELPEAVLTSAAAYASCIAGAVLKEEYLDLIRRADFSDVTILEETGVPFDLAVTDPLLKAGLGSLSHFSNDPDLQESVKSVKVKAIKRA